MRKSMNRRRAKWDEGGRWEGFAACVYAPPKGAFPRFWFEGNQVFEEINSDAKLKGLILQHVMGWDMPVKSTVEKLKSAHRYDKSPRNVPEFGFYTEHTGKETLGEYLEERGILWPQV